jgi:hypothetical protein
MNNQLPTKKNIFEGLQLMFYSNSNSLAGNSTWFGTGGYSGSYRLPDDTIAEKLSDSFKSVSGLFTKLVKSTVLFSFYKVFTSPMPNL